MDYINDFDYGLFNYTKEDIDSEILETINIFNLAGYITEYCCQGHGEVVEVDGETHNEFSMPYISFKCLDSIQLCKLFYEISTNSYPLIWIDIDHRFIANECPDIDAIDNSEEFDEALELIKKTKLNFIVSLRLEHMFIPYCDANEKEMLFFEKARVEFLKELNALAKKVLVFEDVVRSCKKSYVSE